VTGDIVNPYDIDAVKASILRAAAACHTFWPRAKAPGQTQLGVDGEDHPGPPVRRPGGADLRAGPAEGLLEQAEGVLDVEAA
jgi:hypothetical protein